MKASANSVGFLAGDGNWCYAPPPPPAGDNLKTYIKKMHFLISRLVHTFISLSLFTSFLSLYCIIVWLSNDR